MTDNTPDYYEEIDKLDDMEKLDYALFEMEVIYRSRCVDVPLTSNVKVVEVTQEESPPQDDQA